MNACILPAGLAGLLLGCLLALSSCAPAPQLTATLPAAEHAQQAENLIFQNNLAQAEKEYQLAILAAPSETTYYLRRAEILEILGLDQKAREAYTSALLDSDPAPEEYDRIHHRLILLLALKLANPQEASALLPHLTEGSFLYTDAAGAQALAQGHIAQALELFTQAQHIAYDNDDQALALYHVALAYHLLDDPKSTSAALYYAINFAENPALIKDIERLWDELNIP